MVTHEVRWQCKLAVAGVIAQQEQTVAHIVFSSSRQSRHKSMVATWCLTRREVYNGDGALQPAVCGHQTAQGSLYRPWDMTSDSSSTIDDGEELDLLRFIHTFLVQNQCTTPDQQETTSNAWSHAFFHGEQRRDRFATAKLHLQYFWLRFSPINWRIPSLELRTVSLIVLWLLITIGNHGNLVRKQSRWAFVPNRGCLSFGCGSLCQPFFIVWRNYMWK